MSDENIINVTPDANLARPNKTKHERRGNPLGKIARLPYKIREQLNRRIRNNERSRDILPWLNELPAVKKVLAVQFDGKPINSQNFSKWRYGGYKLWLQRQEEVDEIQMLAEDAKDFARTADGNLARGTASVATAKILKMLHTIPPGQGSVNDLTKISFAISALLNADQNQVRLEHEETRVFQGNERLVLSWDKFLRDRVETAQRALNDAICKDIQAADIDNGEKIELLGYELFGKKWKGREVGKKEDVAKEAKGTNKESPNSAEAEKTEGQTADQQVRPTMTPDNGMEVKVSQTEVKETDVQEHIPTEAMDSKAPATPPEPKQEPPARELSPYEKAILEGKTHLEAMYEQFTPDPNPKPKPQEDPSVPKPSPWDTFPEPVKPSPYASLRGFIRRSALG